MNAMKIAYFSNEYPPLIYGGLGVYVDNISRQLAALGQKLAVFSWGNDALPRHERIGGVEVFRQTPAAMRDGLEIFLSPQTLAWGEGLGYLLDLFSYNQQCVSSLLREGPFDLVVAQDWLALPAGMAAKRRGTPLIYHVHGLETGRSLYPNSQLVELERRGAMFADLVLTVSEAMKRELTALGVPKERIRVCYHGVDTEFFDPKKADPEHLAALRSKYGFAQDDIIILFMGRLEPVKGILQLFSALPAVRLEHPKVKLLVVGKGSLEAWARQEASRLGGIRLVTDFLDGKQKMHHYALADLCVFPSLYEPFGIVALEAAAMEKPAVVGASGTSGLAEIVECPASSRPTGVHVNARDPVDLAWGINLALADRGQSRDWGKNARARALECFTWQHAAKKTLEIYLEVAEDDGAG
jgi:glycosyltransferase involved in cell wall biosynthesis